MRVSYFKSKFKYPKSPKTLNNQAILIGLSYGVFTIGEWVKHIYGGEDKYQYISIRCCVVKSLEDVIKQN